MGLVLLRRAAVGSMTARRILPVAIDLPVRGYPSATRHGTPAMKRSAIITRSFTNNSG
jgi:hypothetical protein